MSSIQYLINSMPDLSAAQKKIGYYILQETNAPETVSQETNAPETVSQETNAPETVLI